MTKIKKCSKCGIEKEVDEFTPRKSNKSGITSVCKACTKSYMILWKKKNKENTVTKRKIFYQNNKEKLNKISKTYREKNKEKTIRYAKKYREANKQVLSEKLKAKRHKTLIVERIYNKKNKSKIKDKNKAYRQQNKSKLLAQNRVWRNNNKKYIAKKRRERCVFDVNFRIRTNLATRIWHALKNCSKSAKTSELLGCTVSHLKAHLEKDFAKGMTFENYGTWHIDHIIPCAKFDLTKPEHQKVCFNYKNLQPLWAKDNISKSSKLPTDTQLNLPL